MSHNLSIKSVASFSVSQYSQNVSIRMSERVITIESRPLESESGRESTEESFKDCLESSEESFKHCNNESIDLDPESLENETESLVGNASVTLRGPESLKKKFKSNQENRVASQTTMPPPEQKKPTTAEATSGVRAIEEKKVVGTDGKSKLQAGNEKTEKSRPKMPVKMPTLKEDPSSIKQVMVNKYPARERKAPSIFVASFSGRHGSN